MFILARAVWLALLTALGTRPAAAIFGAAPVMQPFTNNITPGPDNAVGDFTAPVYTGYVDQAIAVAGAFTDPDGNVFLAVGDLIFEVTSAGETTQIWGFIIKDSVAGYRGGVKFDAPVNITGPTGAAIFGQNIKIDPAILLGPPDLG